METRKDEMAALVLRVAMGAYFVYAGGLKIFSSGLNQFAVDIGNYKLADDKLSIAFPHLIPWVENLTIAAAYMLPWLEVVAGICFMLGILKKGAWIAMLGLVFTFTYAVGSAWSRGLDISCGCTGGTEKISYWGKAVEFSVYYAVLGYLAWIFWRKAPTAEA